MLSPDQVVPNSQVVTAKRRRPNTCLPLGDIRFDGHGHLPKWTGNKERCKGDGCKGMFRVTHVPQVQSTFVFPQGPGLFFSLFTLAKSPIIYGLSH